MQRHRVHPWSVIAYLLACCVAWRPANSQTPQKQYQPTEASLNTHPVPQWYRDAKLGIFIHWGLYSVPGWAPVQDAVYDFDDPEWFRLNPYAEWYLNTLRVPGSPTAAYHREHFGSRDYYSFAADFNRETKKWKPDEWAALFADAGARYAVLTTKHHDGFALWPTAVANPKLTGERAHATRDLVGDLEHALQSKQIRFGVYYSGGFDWTFKDGPFLTQKDSDAGTPDSEAYARYVDAQYRELIARYHPDILWNDIRYPAKGSANQIFAEFYNGNPAGVVNDRWSPFWHGDLTTPEYQVLSQISPKKWEECRGLADSFGYNRAEGAVQTLTAEALVHLLVDIVSKNGNLLLDVGPEADGTIPPLQAERLHQLGAWLRQNGEAIYGTEPWTRAEGRTEDGTDVRFTRKGSVVYAVLLSTPRQRRITLPKMQNLSMANVSVLGSSEPTDARLDGSYLRVTLPEKLPGQFAYVLRIQTK